MNPGGVRHVAFMRSFRVISQAGGQRHGCHVDAEILTYDTRALPGMSRDVVTLE